MDDTPGDQENGYANYSKKINKKSKKTNADDYDSYYSDEYYGDETKPG